MLQCFSCPSREIRLAAAPAKMRLPLRFLFRYLAIARLIRSRLCLRGIVNPRPYRYPTASGKRLFCLLNPFLGGSRGILGFVRATGNICQSSFRRSLWATSHFSMSTLNFFSFRLFEPNIVRLSIYLTLWSLSPLSRIIISSGCKTVFANHCEVYEPMRIPSFTMRQIRSRTRWSLIRCHIRFITTSASRLS